MNANDTEERIEKLAGLVSRLYDNLDLLVRVIQGEDPGRRDERLKSLRHAFQQGLSEAEKIRHPEGGG